MKLWKIEEIRAIAVLSVLCAHFSLTNDTMNRIFPGGGYQIPFYLGADLFFVISGFFISREIIRPDFQILKYYKKRICKIYPPLIGVMLMAIALNMVLGQMEMCQDPHLVSTMDEMVAESVYTLAGNLNYEYDVYAYGAFWYIRVLLWCYLVAGIAGFSLCKFVKDRCRVLRILSFTAVICCLAGRMLVLCGVSLHRVPLLEGILMWRADFVLAGVLAGVVDFPVKWQKKRTGWLLVLPMTVSLFTEGALTDFYTAKYQSSIGYSSALICFFLAVGLAAGSAKQDTVPYVKWIASRSYAIYLTQFLSLQIAWIFIRVLQEKVFYLTPWIFGVEQMIFGSVTCVLVSEFVYRKNRCKEN